MYYLHIYNSEKEEGSIVLPFEDMQPMINFVVDQYQKTIKRLKTNNKKYQKITSTWDKNKYDETLEESIKNYEFECNISEEMFSGEVTLPGAAYIWFEDIGVEFEFCIENGENYSAIYRMDMNKAGDDFETDHDEFYHYEIDPTDPEWKANLEIEMCRVLILLHDLK